MKRSSPCSSLPSHRSEEIVVSSNVQTTNLLKSPPRQIEVSPEAITPSKKMRTNSDEDNIATNTNVDTKKFDGDFGILCTSKPIVGIILPVSLDDDPLRVTPECSEGGSLSSSDADSTDDDSARVTPPRLNGKRLRRDEVTFNENVSVHQIPLWTEYPADLRQRIWSDASEIYENAARNTVEFLAEGWNWRDVVDDEDMICVSSGELIHPVHFENSVSSNQETSEDDSIEEPFIAL
mmetsp:Transcript_20360/g.40662  ORF Transcript_20360/g.40662 Transcript_20360/m.40662 type:complete len:236 (-) Transcript_20360:171-878(-)|eukprot:CAMPEP_0194323794 /NCGR_PEP_ID=MMETSP0171-20130528/25965_1 /TAXON_ID=218684 /ORGANISM="Corethron pennatum, Strain L29A3" /LENGTH=235 /DNA_ID=CAMNT_0039082519 /DNA_START=64 /DNA_END=771 /DNA_ORIENTATION=-